MQAAPTASAGRRGGRPTAPSAIVADGEVRAGADGGRAAGAGRADLRADARAGARTTGAAAEPPSPASAPERRERVQMDRAHRPRAAGQARLPRAVQPGRLPLQAHDRARRRPARRVAACWRERSQARTRAARRSAPIGASRRARRLLGIDRRSTSSRASGCPLPSVAADARILAARTEPPVEVTFARDGADNQYVMSPAGGRHRLIWLTDAPARYFGGELPAGLRLADEPRAAAAGAAGGATRDAAHGARAARARRARRARRSRARSTGWWPGSAPSSRATPPRPTDVDLRRSGARAEGQLPPSLVRVRHHGDGDGHPGALRRERAARVRRGVRAARSAGGASTSAARSSTRRSPAPTARCPISPRAAIRFRSRPQFAKGNDATPPRAEGAQGRRRRRQERGRAARRRQGSGKRRQRRRQRRRRRHRRRRRRGSHARGQPRRISTQLDARSRAGHAGRARLDGERGHRDHRQRRHARHRARRAHRGRGRRVGAGDGDAERPARRDLPRRPRRRAHASATPSPTPTARGTPPSRCRAICRSAITASSRAHRATRAQASRSR